ncbi:hypothetical protein H7J87_15410 [Mycolicibacterium wolinskyi]|uniref:DUF4365 domain-containing protein n=1 Tax=Mycolicibacterium wolinskyi TaxID=59750 RepID=A0A1X2F845_9MYCO|nr:MULTISPECIES: hypothetical protein [Mycolicibacterium]MCV7286715.1 hypothetical protein [Mycolicibacterium wolinskyi]MCV7293695.1 hypothetical protein [Mycolicibacterium goodii]ORX14586.1 hypothetical protein AWC31_25730 [Mycolicibacterium wolinskyi]
MTTSAKLGTQAIGAAGELFIQYQLLKRGIDSARLTTDSGIDLVMCVPGAQEAATIQVKSVLNPAPAGGTGHPTLAWIFPDACKAQWLAGVDLSRDLAWLFPIDDARRLAQQHGPDGSRTLYWYLTDVARRRVAGIEAEYDHYRLDAVITGLLNGQPRELP